MTEEQLNTNVIEFDYTKQALEELRNKYSGIQLDKESLAEAIKELVKVRGVIEKKGKSLRDKSNAYNKAVLQKENEYVAIIEPLEKQFKEKVKEIEREEILEARRLIMPQRKELLVEFDTVNIVDDDILLGLDDIQFMTYLSETKNQHRDNLQRRQDQEEREKRIAEEARENAIKEEREKEAKRLADEARKIEEEQDKIRSEKEKLEKDERYQTFLKENGYIKDSDEFFIIEDQTSYKLYKKINTLNK